MSTRKPSDTSRKECNSPPPRKLFRNLLTIPKARSLPFEPILPDVSLPYDPPSLHALYAGFAFRRFATC